MAYQFNHKEKYLYDNHFTTLSGAKINEVSFVGYSLVPVNELHIIESNCPQKNIADTFINSVQSATGFSGIDDIFEQKLKLTEDRNYLIINEIMEKDSLHKQNLASLYHDIFMVEKWRTQRSYPESYQKDKTWMEFNKMELSLRDQIRRELKDSIQSISFNEKDLRESLLDFKKQSQKNQMMGSMFGDITHDLQPNEGYNLNNITGDNYRI